MRARKWIHNTFTLIIAAQFLLSLVAPASGYALAAEQPLPAALPRAGDSAPGISEVASSLAGAGPAAPAAPADTTLSVDILSSPWGALDHNSPEDMSTPHVFVIEARVSNTGGSAAEDVMVTLDYNDPVNGWVLLPGEDPQREVPSLGAGDSYYAYWFARYPSTIAASYTYTVTADADNASAVSTSDNYYGNPETGKTVKTRSYRSTGNSGLNQVSADIVVGVAFTITVKYDLGTGPEDITFSPTGDTGFDPSAYRLLNSQVRFYNDAGTWESTFYDRLFFDTLNASAENAEATFIFIALTPTDTSLCSYAAIGYTIPKYDQFYCSEKNGTIINISGEISLSMLKQASHITILQGETLTYTIQYSNSGDLPLTYAWVWDEVDTSIGSINTASIDPAYDPDWTTDSQVAWYIGDIGASGVPTSTGTTTFTITIDGNGLDLDDGAQLVNYAFFGVEPGSLPNNAALTSTFTTTVQAPVISIQKSDGLTNVEPGDTLTYTLQIQNSGSAAATNVVITDVLPAYVTPIGATTPVTDTQDGQTLVWNSLGPIAAGGGSLTIKIPVQVDIKAPNGEVLSNQATIQYSNLAGYVFETKSATDHTTVNAPLLSISKSDYPDPVLSGRSIEYTLNYANNGPAAATNVVITDVVPISTTFETGSCSPSCSVNGGVVTWSLGSIPANSNGSVSFSVLVDSDLETGALIYNDDYGIVSDQTDFYAGVAITTLVRKDAAFFDGYAFIDEDGDGIFDGGEGTLTGVTVTLDAATVPVTYTDSSGYYHFRVETEDPVMITAGEWPGYFRTTPGSVYLDSTLGVTQTVNFGYAPITSTFGVIYGAVYQDDNHDGSQDLGEQGLASVQISSAEAATSPVTTDGNGLYTLRFEASQSVTVTETNPTYYVSTTPDVIYASVTTGSDNGSPKNFGDFLGIKITGQVFDDADVDGAKDLGESGLAGADVAANGDSYTTLSSGVYTLYVALSGSGAVQIEETDPSGYVSTNAIPGTGMSRIDANTLEIGAPVSGAVYTGGDFGDVLTSGAITITGQVWNDNGAGSYLANGALDPGEPGLAGALISLSSGLTQTTGSDGVFSLYAPPNTIITVTETNPSGYVSTNAIPGDDLITSKVDNDTLVVSALSSGSTADGNLFGDVLPSSVAVVSGAVFDDENKNGVLDAGEAGLADVQVSMAIEGGATIAVMTGSDGNYQFAVAPGTDIRITSDGPGGSYLPTTPETIVLRPPAAGTFPGNNFGYGIYSEDVAVVYGIVFNDNNSDGDQDFGELGLGGAIVALNSTISTTTSSSGGLAGMFTFTVTHTLGEEVVYALHETNPSGYRSTTPDVINVPVEMNHSYYVEFGDTNNPNTASIYGTAFDDFSGDGVQDADEPGLPGVVISMTTGTGVLYATTKSYGQFTYGFIVTQPGFHTVSEQDPAKPGYRSTTPDKINVYVEQGRSYNVNFGDTNLGFATIIGVVYNDESGDGIQDPSELGIEGVTISLSTGATTTTREFGDYTFPIDTASLLRVIEIDPPGFHSTTPNTVTLAIDTSMTYQVDFGDSDAELLSSFFGTVFDDQNADGAWDLEPGLAGITVTINNGISYDYVTNYLGQYTFLIESPGAYTVTETDPAGWVSTNAIPGDPAVTKVDNNTLRVDVTLGTDYGENLFGDVQASQVFTVTGAVWDDNGAGVGGVRGDGLRNGTEPGLAGATVSLSSGMFQVTGADGSFTLHAPAGQPVTVTETNPSGYISTAAIAGNDASKVDLDTLVVNALSGGATSAGNLFGDVSPGSVAVITGVVFEDANGNGERDAGEAGISGVEITLDDTFTKTTETDGSYIFFTPTAGKHTLVETDKAGYFSTTPNQVQVEVELGESYQVDFGDKLIEGAEFASVYGTVFEDANGNGGQDDGELGIAGVTVTL
ncbi:MAG: DUF11 domain-containing protein, partial [Anaerolineales bacterium]|nr:DUF11 domain-containing protein [Anaerolineales bacterium]